MGERMPEVPTSCAVAEEWPGDDDRQHDDNLLPAQPQHQHGDEEEEQTEVLVLERRPVEGREKKDTLPCPCCSEKPPR